MRRRQRIARNSLRDTELGGWVWCGKDESVGKRREKAGHNFEERDKWFQKVRGREDFKMLQGAKEQNC